MDRSSAAQDQEWMPARMTNARATFRFVLPSNGETWNWPVEGEDSIRAFGELLMHAEIHYTRDLWFGLEPM
jgi:hypothetical protein